MGSIAAICEVISAYIWSTDILLMVAVDRLLIDEVLMAVTCAVDMAASCTLLKADISVEVVAAIEAVLNALICVVV